MINDHFISKKERKLGLESISLSILKCKQNNGRGVGVD